MRSIAALALMTMALSSPAAANEISIKLNAQVAAMCSVQNIAPVDMSRGQIAVDVTCNSANFLLEMGGDLSGVPLAEVSASNATLTRSGDKVSVQSFRPGSFRVILDYHRDLSDLSQVTASLHAL